jgi:Zn-dependent protease
MLLAGDFDPQQIIFLIVSIIIGFSFHEFAHALAADLLGDPTPRDQGRLTLSPAAHLDIIGTLMFLLAWFGWAKPVEVNPSNFKNRRRDDLLVSLAGPASNLLLAFLLARLFLFPIPGPYELLLNTMINVNVVLAIFNMIPIPPLDGSRIIVYFLPEKARDAWATFEQYSMIAFIVLILSGATNLILEYPVGIALSLVRIGI